MYSSLLLHNANSALKPGSAPSHQVHHNTNATAQSGTVPCFTTIQTLPYSQGQLPAVNKFTTIQFATIELVWYNSLAVTITLKCKTLGIVSKLNQVSRRGWLATLDWHQAFSVHAWLRMPRFYTTHAQTLRVQDQNRTFMCARSGD